MLKRRLGCAGPEASAIHLGCMSTPDFCGPADRKESLATIDGAVERAPK